MTDETNAKKIGKLEETTITLSYYVDEDSSKTRPVIQQPLPE